MQGADGNPISYFISSIIGKSTPWFSLTSKTLHAHRTSKEFRKNTSTFSSTYDVGLYLTLQARFCCCMMTTLMSSGAAYPPELSAEENEHLITTIKDWSIAHGLAVRPPPSFISTDADPKNVLATTAPVTLFPSPFPRVCFDQAKTIQKAYNGLYASISQDESFLKDIVEEYVIYTGFECVICSGLFAFYKCKMDMLFCWAALI